MKNCYFSQGFRVVLPFYDYYVLFDYVASFCEHQKVWFIQKKNHGGEGEYSVP